MSAISSACSPESGWRDQQRVGVDAERLGVVGVERVLGVDERHDAAGRAGRWPPRAGRPSSCRRTPGRRSPPPGRAAGRRGRARRRARSSPVGMTSSGARVSSPRRITEPLPNCCSMLASAASSAFSRSPPAMDVVRPSVRLEGEPAVFFIASDTREDLRQSSSPMSRPGENSRARRRRVRRRRLARTGVRAEHRRADTPGEPGIRPAAAPGTGSRAPGWRPRRCRRCASTMPLTIASPSPAPAPPVASAWSGVRAALPCQATSKTRAMSSSRHAAAAVGHATARRRRRPPGR